MSSNISLFKFDVKDKLFHSVRSYRRFNVLGTVVKALNMAENQNGGMVADFRHLVRELNG